MDLFNILISNGFKADRYGHSQREYKGTKFRMKVTRRGRNLRFERQIILSRGEKEWFAIWSKAKKSLDLEKLDAYLISYFGR